MAEPFAAIKELCRFVIVRESVHVDIVEKPLNRHDNHRGNCGPVLRTMPVSILNSSVLSAHLIGDQMKRLKTIAYLTALLVTLSGCRASSGHEHPMRECGSSYPMAR
jgi:hypothetical protein